MSHPSTRARRSARNGGAHASVPADLVDLLDSDDEVVVVLDDAAQPQPSGRRTIQRLRRVEGPEGDVLPATRVNPHPAGAEAAAPPATAAPASAAPPAPASQPAPAPAPVSTPAPAVAAAGDSDGELDGAGCPICMEPMADAGPHRPAALRCGHLFGEGCVRRWLAEAPRPRCPQCNSKAKVKDIRLLYNLPVAIAPAPAPRPEDAAALAELRRQLDQERRQRQQEREERERLQAQLAAIAGRTGAGRGAGGGPAPAPAAQLAAQQQQGWRAQQQAGIDFHNQQQHYQQSYQQQQHQYTHQQQRQLGGGGAGSAAGGGGIHLAHIQQQQQQQQRLAGSKRPATNLGADLLEQSRPSRNTLDAPASAMAPRPAVPAMGPPLRLAALPDWGDAAGAAHRPPPVAPGALTVAQTYACRGSRAFSLQGSMLLLAESTPPGGTGAGAGTLVEQRLRKVSIYMPGSASHIRLSDGPTRVARVCAVAPQPLEGGGKLVAVGTQGAGLLIASTDSNCVVHRLQLPGSCVWSAAWSAACDQQVMIGLDRGRLGLVDLRMTGGAGKGLLLEATAPGVQQPLRRLEALGAGVAGGTGAACLVAAPGGVYAWSDSGSGAGGGGGGFTQLLDARSVHGGNCESVALTDAPSEVVGGGAAGPLVCVSFRAPLAAAGGQQQEQPAAAHLLFSLERSQGAGPAAAPTGASAAAAAAGVGGDAAARSLRATARLAGHTSCGVVTVGDFVRLPSAHGPSPGLAYFSGDERSNTVAAWDCGSGAMLGGGGGGGAAAWESLAGPVLQVSAAPGAGGGGSPLIGALCESQLVLWRWDAAARHI